MATRNEGAAQRRKVVSMADDSNGSKAEPTNDAAAGGTEPHGEGAAAAADATDWKAEARKWEKLAKKAEKQADGRKTAEEQLSALREELDAMKAERDQEKWLSEVAAETGVDASLIRGSSKEEMAAHAAAIAKAYKKPAAPSGQSDTRKGDGGGAKLTKADILAIKSSRERKAAIRENIELFDKN